MSLGSPKRYMLRDRYNPLNNALPCNRYGRREFWDERTD